MYWARRIDESTEKLYTILGNKPHPLIIPRFHLEGQVRPVKKYFGVSASPGRVAGPVYRLRHTHAGLGRSVGAPQSELETYEAAVQQACEELEALGDAADAQDRDIFMAQRMMIRDEGLAEETRAYIRVGAGAAAAVERAAGVYADKLRSIGDDYLSARACDVLDVSHRVVSVLDAQKNELTALTKPVILASEEIYPSDIVALARGMVLGFVTSRGGVNAHAAIIARTMGIPAIVMAGDEFLEVCNGKYAVLDGGSGAFVLEPDEATKARFSHSMRMEQRRILAQGLHAEPCVTQDGTAVTLYANCAAPDDVSLAISLGAQGVGLLHSDYVLMAGRMRTEDEQVEFYTECLRAARGLPVHVVTYDIGADKTLYGQEPESANPALGLRGVRFCLANKTFFILQLAALLRAALYGDLRIVLPMVTSVEEMLRVEEILEETRLMLRRRSVRFKENVPVGVLIETPAAALLSDERAGHASFFAIGTNDLTQYTHAADRADASVQAYYPDRSRAVEQLVSIALENAARAGIPAFVCGNSTDPVYAERYVRGGARMLSIYPRSIPAVRERLSQITL